MLGTNTDTLVFSECQRNLLPIGLAFNIGITISNGETLNQITVSGTSFIHLVDLYIRRNAAAGTGTGLDFHRNLTGNDWADQKVVAFASTTIIACILTICTESTCTAKTSVGGIAVGHVIGSQAIVVVRSYDMSPVACHGKAIVASGNRSVEVHGVGIGENRTTEREQQTE